MKIAPNARLKVYPGASHGLCSTHKDQVSADLLEFLKLEDLRKMPTGALSYGLQKRVELGRALALEWTTMPAVAQPGGETPSEQAQVLPGVPHLRALWYPTRVHKRGAL